MQKTGQKATPQTNLVCGVVWVLQELCGLSSHDQLEQNRGNQCRDDNDEDDRTKQRIRNQTERRALLGNNQSDFTARYHADADGERFVIAEVEQLGAETTADNFGQNRNQEQQNSKDEQRQRQAAQIGFQTNTREEYR